MLATLLLLALTLVAAATDLLRHKIYNWTTYSGILAALALNALGTALLAGGRVERSWLEETLGYVGLADSLAGLAICGLLMLVCYVLLKLGGGDVKLMAMLGAMLGTQDGIEAMLWTFVLGMCLAVIVLIWRIGPLPLAGIVFRQVTWTLRLRFFGQLSDEERGQLQSPLFLAPCATAAVLIVRFWRPELV